MVLEYLAFFIAFRYYLFLRRRSIDHISSNNRLSIILGAVIGALAGSRLAGFMEDPTAFFHAGNLWQLLQNKSIMGGLFGGLLGVEIAKKIIHEKQSSGDLFTLPIILGIMIGRVGCFLSGVKEFTYGNPTTFFTGVNLGDGLKRHPVSLYEIAFLALLFVLLYRIRGVTQKENCMQFKLFMLCYFAFRFFIEFIKPNVYYLVVLSSNQWLCIVCWVYYLPAIKKIINHAYKKVHIL